MVVGCPHIDQAIKLAISIGNEIYSTTERDQENNNFVIDMRNPLTSLLKEKIDTICSSLRYWEFKGVPHNPAESGYTCDACKVVLIFPGTATPSKRRY